jgi:hypothetical protein
MRLSELQARLPSTQRDEPTSGSSWDAMGLDLSRSLAVPRSSGAYARGMYACEDGHMTCEPLLLASVPATIVHIH